MRDMCKGKLAVAVCLSCFLCSCSENQDYVEETSISGWETITEGIGSETEMRDSEGETIVQQAEGASTKSQDDLGDETISVEPVGEVGSIPTAYSEILDTIREAMKKQVEVLDMDTDYLPAEYYQGYSIGYAMKDIDGNGIEELILETISEQYESSFIYAIFTLSNNKAIQVVNYGGARNRYYICSDGTIENQGSGGAAYSSWTYYKLIGTELVLQEGVFTSPDEEDETMACWYYTTTAPYEDTSTKITDEKAEEIMGHYTEVELNVALLE